VDGFSITLPNIKEVFLKYGKPSYVAHHPTAFCSSVYDILNEVILDSNLNPFGVGERQRAIENFENIRKELKKQKFLLIADRGYPGTAFFYELISRNIDFIIRIQSNQYREFTDQMKGKVNDYIKIYKINRTRKNGLKEYIHLFNKLGYEIKLRVVKIKLKNGKYEFLITNLLDQNEFPYSEFKELYSKRWNVETLIKRKKVLYEFENFASKTNLRIEQEFHAKIFMMNIGNLIMNEADEEINEENKNTNKVYKVNRNIGYGIIKLEIMNILCKNTNINYEIAKIKNAIKKYKIYSIKGRKSKRLKIRRYLCFHWNQRRNC
jgi:hypothetical protein